MEAIDWIATGVFGSLFLFIITNAFGLIKLNKIVKKPTKK